MAAELRTHRGNVRRENEDAAFMDARRGVFAVADGMGGHQAGEVASRIAVDAVRRMARSGEPAGIAPMTRAVRAAHEEIVAHAQAHPECAGMGTTLTAMWYAGGRFVYIAHVGDSRIYRLRDGRLQQITQDHSLVEELVLAGLITREEARVHPRRNIITRALGTEGDNAPDMLAADVRPGDVWLLCTDGLSSMVDDVRISRALLALPPERAADELVRLALSAGGRDNVTVIVATLDGEGEPWNRD